MFAGSCIGVVLLAILLEFLRRVGKEYDALILRQFKRHADSQQAVSSVKSADDAGNCCSDVPATKPQPKVLTFRASPLQQLTRAVIHAITFGVAYIIMLLAMYYNGYIIICIILGTGIGKFICDWMVHKVVVGGTETGIVATGIEEPTVCCA
jgi:solute carrier family 31 (copper transporter), member 1